MSDNAILLENFSRSRLVILGGMINPSTHFYSFFLSSHFQTKVFNMTTILKYLMYTIFETCLLSNVRCIEHFFELYSQQSVTKRKATLKCLNKIQQIWRQKEGNGVAFKTLYIWLVNAPWDHIYLSSCLNWFSFSTQQLVHLDEPQFPHPLTGIIIPSSQGYQDNCMT